MPINPIDYPPDWPAISARIRARAGDRCEWCKAANHQPHPITGSRVVLTVAHLDQDRSHNADDNLACLCQRCHFGWDRPFNVVRSSVTRRRNRDAARGQLALIPYETPALLPGWLETVRSADPAGGAAGLRGVRDLFTGPATDPT